MKFVLPYLHRMKIWKIKGLIACGRKLKNIGRKRILQEEFFIDGAESKLFCHLHYPEGGGRFPGLLLVPWGGFPGTCFDSKTGVVNADDLASMGFCILHFDPQGRGLSGGRDDFWGESHQEDMRRALAFLLSLAMIEPDKVGVASFSLGISISAGGLAGFDDIDRIRFLLDWEGPSNRFNITLKDTKKELAGRFPLSDTKFWEKREAVRFIGRVRCRYFRIQSEIDHVQGRSKEHAIELLNTATRGSALWTRCNDNPTNMLFYEDRVDEYHWLRPRLDYQPIIALYLMRLFDGDYDSVPGIKESMKRD